MKFDQLCLSFRPVLLLSLFLNMCSPVLAHNCIQNKVVVIIGASSGFGKGVARKMSDEGALLVLAARRKPLLDELAAECGNRAIAVKCDISEPADVQAVAQTALQKFGHVDVWINDVGVGAIGKFEDIPIEDHARLVDVNLNGIIYGSHAAMKIFDKQQFGTLINLGSIDSEVPLAYQSSYAASKAAVRSLDSTLRQEIRLSHNKNIHVCTIMPWAVDTPWWGHAANYSGHRPQMAAMDAPNIVVDAIVKAAVHPKKEVHVGWKSKMSYLTHRVAPGFSERFSADIAQKYQIEKSPPRENTDGSLMTPMMTGTDVSGNVRAQMKGNDRQVTNTR